MKAVVDPIDNLRVGGSLFSSVLHHIDKNNRTEDLLVTRNEIVSFFLVFSHTEHSCLAV